MAVLQLRKSRPQVEVAGLQLSPTTTEHLTPRLELQTEDQHLTQHLNTLEADNCSSPYTKKELVRAYEVASASDRRWA